MLSSFFASPHPIAVIKNIEQADEGKVIVFDIVNSTEGDAQGTALEGWEFVQTEVMTRAGIAVHKYGAFIIPKTAEETPIVLAIKMSGLTYVSENAAELEVGALVPLTVEGGLHQVVN